MQVHVVAVVFACLCVGGEETIPMSLNFLKQQTAGSQDVRHGEIWSDEHGTGTSTIQMLVVQ